MNEKQRERKMFLKYKFVSLLLSKTTKISTKYTFISFRVSSLYPVCLLRNGDTLNILWGCNTNWIFVALCVWQFKCLSLHLCCGLCVCLCPLYMWIFMYMSVMSLCIYVYVCVYLFLCVCAFVVCVCVCVYMLWSYVFILYVRLFENVSSEV